jgi:hypothetical protein
MSIVLIISMRLITIILKRRSRDEMKHEFNLGHFIMIVYYFTMINRKAHIMFYCLVVNLR